MSSTKRILTALALSGTLASSFAGQAAEPAPTALACPAQFSLQGSNYPLRAAQVFEGPIEEQVSLVPEFPADQATLATWSAGTGKLSFLQCRYQGIKHYIVLNIEGVQSCQAQLSNGTYTSVTCQ